LNIGTPLSLPSCSERMVPLVFLMKKLSFKPRDS
jgi:hypothetical protein